MKIIDSGDIDGRAFMNPADMTANNIEDFDIIMIIAGGGMKTAVQVVSSDACPPGEIKVDSSALHGTELHTGSEVVVQKTLPRGGILEVQLSVDPRGNVPIESAIIWVAEHANQIANLLKRRPVWCDFEITWEDADICPLHLKILQTVPPLREGEVAIIDTSGTEVVFDLLPAREMGFNSILCIDVSGSMVKEDFTVHDIQGVLDYLKKEYSISEELGHFFEQFKEGANVSRISSAVVATLLYLSLKANRGLGEHVQLITFGDDVEVLEMENEQGVMSPVIECAGTMRELNLNTLAWYIIEKARNASGLTTMSPALKIASDQVACFPKQQHESVPTMIIILSDGNPNKGDDVKGIPVNPVPVARQIMREGLVLYTIGMGEADDLLMQIIGKDIGRGEYFRASNLGELWNFYESLAKHFSIAATSREGSKTIDAGIESSSRTAREPIDTRDEPRAGLKPAMSGKRPESTKHANDQISVKAPGPKQDEVIDVFFTSTVGPGEKKVKLSIRMDASLDNVKRSVGTTFGLIPVDFHLAYGGITMDENRKVSDYQVKQGATVLLIPASHAGKHKPF